MAIIKNVMAKMQRYEYMRRFLLYGEMYMNTLQTFAKMDECDGIGDKFENSIAYTFYDLKSISETKDISNLMALSIREYIETNKGNIYSMALVDCNIDGGKISIQDESLISSIGSNYDTIVIIANYKEFLSRCKKTVSDLGFTLYSSKVDYFSENEYYNKKLEITPFMKRDKYKSQNEFRLFVDFNSYSPKIIKIGNISDIAFLIHKSGICSLNDELPESI